MTKLKNFLKLAIPYLIAILSFIGGKYQFAVRCKVTNTEASTF